MIMFFNNYFMLVLVLCALVLRGLAEHFLACLFFACYFIFLMGQKLFKKEKNVFLTFVRTELNPEQFNIFLLIITMGISVTYFSYMIDYDHKKQKLEYRGKQKHYDWSKMIPIIRILWFFTLPLAVYMQAKIVIVRNSMSSYEAGYLVNVELPPLIKACFYLFNGFTYIYLAMKPSKKEVYFVLLAIIVINGGIQLIQGRRALFATTVFFIVWYLFKYYQVKKLDLKFIVGFGIGCLALIVLFFFVEMNRGGKHIAGAKIGYIIRDFMVSTGGSDSVIGNTIVHKNVFPKKGIVYLLNPIVDNPIFNLVSGKNGYVQGPDYVQNFDNFSHWISFLTNSELYMLGYGMGSCYLAEAYLSFGLFGVFMVSVLVGVVLSCITNVNLGASVFNSSIACLLVQNVFTLPRSGLFGWFGDFIYLLVSLCFIYPFWLLFYKI